MNKKIIIIAGYLASGKSTFALRLSEELNIPYLIKDTFKSAICTNIPIMDREESKRFSVATFDAIVYVTERFMETGYPLIIEGNFEMDCDFKANEGDVLKALIEKYDYKSLTYIFCGDTRTLYERFNQRENLPERGQANQLHSEITYEDFDKWIKPLADFTVDGRTVKIDTTNFDDVDFKRYIEIAHNFILS